VKKIILCAIAAVLFLGALPAYASGSFYTYTYSTQAEPQHSPDAFTPTRSVSAFGDGDSFYMSEDLKVDKITQNIYVADSGNNRIVVFDRHFNLLQTVEEFTDNEENTETFNSPEGVFIDQSNIYVCDTENERIVVFDKQWKFNKYITRPENASLPADFIFKPSKLAVDLVDRYNIICKNNIMGIVLIDRQGLFQGFAGAIKVIPSPTQIFWRRFMTEKQLEDTSRLVPSPYNNVYADSDGFIYATTSSYENPYTIHTIIQSKDQSGNYSPVKRFGPSGKDILKRNAVFQPVGELNFKIEHMNPDVGHSAIEDIAVAKNNVYTLMDTRYGKLFTYDSEGNLLYAFGGKGTSLGKFMRLVSIDYSGENDEFLLALDGNTNSITLFSKTEYGLLLDKAITASLDNDSQQTVMYWNEVKKNNNNFDLAYREIGKALIKDEKYDEAMTHLKYANNKSDYSTAFKFYRAQRMEKWAILVPIALILIFWLIAKALSKAKKYNSTHTRTEDKKTVREQLIFGLHLVFHPFDGFWDLKNEKKGSFVSATVILASVTASFLVSAMTTGFLFREGTTAVFNVFSVILKVAGPVILWTTANWSLTSLMDGKGRLVEIYTATCYAALPLLFVTVPVAILSNFLILDESVIISTISSVSVLWVVMLIYAGVVSTHQYTATRALFVCLFTVAAIGAMLFIGLLFYSVSEKLIVFLSNLIKEISFRL